MKTNEPQKSTKDRKKRELIPDQEKIEMALARFDQVKVSGKLTAFESLAGKFPGRDPSVIARAIESAFKQELVEVVKVSKERFERDHKGEQQLLEKYEKLRVAFVIKPQNAPARSEKQLSDDVHEALGHAMAKLISENMSMFDDNDKIGLGSGRGVFHIADAITKYPQTRAQRVQLISLTGAVYALAHAGTPSLLLDADININLFARFFSRQVTLMPVSHPIASSGTPNKWFSNLIPTHALIGVGVLAPGHRLYDEVKKQGGEKETRLEPIEKDLSKLIPICDDIHKRYGYWPVGDVCNFLLYVESPEKPQRENEIRGLIQSLNGRMLTIAGELKQVDSILLVAGTKPKMRIIKQLLDDPEYRIRYLCTDSGVAKYILEGATS
jgi:DNA-binding transcriptional regulator LsrR (DeoR family)